MELLFSIFVKIFKKEDIMLHTYSKISILVLLVVFSSCVSKKKYLEMESGRLKAEEYSQQLDEENKAKAARIEAMIADYEKMKNELLESNAIKDHYIDSLSGEIFTLTENLNKQKESLQETSFTLDFEQQRLNDALNEKEKSIVALQSQVKQLENEVSEKNSVIEQKNFELGKANDQALVLTGKIQTSDKKVTDLQEQLNKSKTEIVKLQEQMKTKDETITRLENNVKLLKKELGQ